MLPFRKTEDPKLNINDASAILERIFEANHVAPNTISLEELVSYSNYRKERFALQRMILVLVMVLFLLLPFLFIAPFFSISLKPDSAVNNPVYSVEVDTFMPVERITAAIEGRNIPVYEVASHVYSIEPTVNGKMEVAVTLVNRQTIVRHIDVMNVDLDTPNVLSNSFDEKHFYLRVSDSGSGVNFEKIRAVSLRGEEATPLSCDEASGQIVFAYPEETLNVYIPDNADNTLQLVLTVP